MTWLQIFNYFFQFSGFRVCRIVDDVENRQYGWGILGPVVPLTGWKTNYIGFPTLRIMWHHVSDSQG